MKDYVLGPSAGASPPELSVGDPLSRSMPFLPEQGYEVQIEVLFSLRPQDQPCINLTCIY